MDVSAIDRSQPSHPLLRFRKASQAVHATQALDEVVTRIIAELHSALDADAASVALLDETSGETILHAAGPVADKISGLRLPPERGIIGWVLANGQSAIVNDVPTDSRFWPEVDGYSGFATKSVLCAPLLVGNQVVGALEVLNKRHGDFTEEDLNYLEIFGAVAASAIENAKRFQNEQRQRRTAEALRRAWETLTVPRSPNDLLDVILDQLRSLIEYRSASILLIAEDGNLELGACRGIDKPDDAAQVVRKLGVDTKVRTMLETRQALLIADTRSDTRWQHFPGFSYIRSWIGAPLLIKGHLVGTLNLDHDSPSYFNDEHLHLLMDYAHQAAIAIENNRLHATTHEATVQLAEQARRMVTLYEASRTLLGGLELDYDALYELVCRITELIGARYGILSIQASNIRPALLIAVSPVDEALRESELAAVQYGILDTLSSECEVIRSREFEAAIQTNSLPSTLLKSFLGVAIHARGCLLGQLLLADKTTDPEFSQDDEALALVLATNLAGAIENAALYRDTQQRLRELTALYEISRTFTAIKDTADVYTHLTTQFAKLLNATQCAFFILRNGELTCQSPGYGLPPDIIPHLSFPVSEDDPLYTFIQNPDPLVSNEAMEDPNLVAFYPLLAQLKIHRMLSCRIAIDEHQVGLLLAANKLGGEEFSEQDRHLVSIMAQHVSNVLQRALLQNRQREQAQIQAALLQVSQAISSLTDLDELLQTIAHITHQLVGCDHCFFAPWADRETAFLPRAQSGLDPHASDSLLQMRLRPADFPHISQATEMREPVLLSRADIRDSIPSWAQDLLGKEHSLIVPLVTQERAVGLIICANSKTSHPPGKREIALVTGIARQAAVAIENANLYRDLHAHASRLERAYEELKDLDERKTQFIQNVSHELRTPLTIVKGYLELFQEEQVDTLSDQQKEALAIITEKTATLDKLVQDIVTIQSIDDASLEPVEFDLRALSQSAMSSLQTHAPGFRLQGDFPSDLPNVEADPNLVERVLGQLLENAVKFSPKGGLITMRARPEGDMLRVEVIDQGIGIPQEALPYVFDQFFQVDGSTTRRFGGTGLGLSIVKQIIAAHGGDVGVYSVEGQGSTFYFTLPLASPVKQNEERKFTSQYSER